MLAVFTMRWPRTRKFWERYKNHAPTAALVIGFFWDYFLFQRPDQLLENVLIISHIILAGGGIIVLNARGKEIAIARIPLILLVQFNFGALAKSLLVLYSKSGTWEGSAVFFIVFGLLVLGNELSRNRYEDLHFHISAFYVVLLLYFALIVPVLLHSISPLIFSFSIIVSLAVIAGFVGLLTLSVPKSVAGRLSNIAFWIWGITIGFVLLYVLNIIPPVPLALQEIGMYHSLVRQGSTYALTYEKAVWWQPWRSTNSIYHVQGGEGAYCWSAIFAPSGLSTSIIHVWQKYDEQKKTWTDEARIRFPINGGRDNGYRGYSKKDALDVGQWRCNVETQRGALIGRVEFTVAPGVATLAQVEL